MDVVYAMPKSIQGYSKTLKTNYIFKKRILLAYIKE